MKKYLWWPDMKKEIAIYMHTHKCQKVKAECQRTVGLFQPLVIPQWKWEHISMDFMTGLWKSAKSNNANWVIVGRLIKTTHFIPFRIGQSMKILAKRFMQEVVRLHGVPATIVLHRYTRFRSLYRKSLMNSLGIHFALFSAYYSQIDG